jgi:peptide/nickel transport system substrate-binding protein
MRPQGGAVNQMGVGMTERWRRLAGLFALIAALTFAVAACGGGDDEGSGGTTTEASGAGAERAFPEFKSAYEPIDYMDPGLSYSVQGWGIMWNVYLGLLTYKHVDGPEGAELIPALAEDLPEISEDGLTYSFTLRENLKYSDGSPVKASDFPATIKRLFLVDSPGVGFFTGIVGAEQFAETKKGEISGITVDDDARTIEIKLAKTQGDFLHILAMVFAGFVPANTPAKDQSTTPPPGTGPYMVEAFVPNRSATVVRNPNYVEIEGVPKGNPDKMTFTIVEEDSASLQSVIDGNNDYSSHPIPVDRLGEVQNQYADQLKLYTPANTYYYFMNERLAPFNKLEVRQAVNYAIDREAIVRLYGGLATATENVLPPTYPQYKKISMYPHDMEKAKQLVQQSGTAGQAVTVWSSTRETHQKAAEYLTDILNQLGYKAKLRAIDPAIYWATIGAQRTKAQAGLANWFQDYPHPLNWFDTLLNGNRITEEHNNNYGNADVAAVNNKIEELKKEPELNDATNAQWAEVDQMVLENASWAPFVNRQFTDFFTPEMDLTDCYVNHVLYQFDYIQICKKG